MTVQVPMVEAMVALVLVDALMQQQAQCGLFPVGMNGSGGSAPNGGGSANRLGKRLDTPI